MRRAGSASPEATSAARTRSLASLTALSGNPTMAKCGSPGATWTCTSTARASMPSNATVVTRWTISSPPPARQRSATAARRKEHLGNRAAAPKERSIARFRLFRPLPNDDGCGPPTGRVGLCVLEFVSGDRDVGPLLAGFGPVRVGTAFDPKIEIASTDRIGAKKDESSAHDRFVLVRSAAKAGIGGDFRKGCPHQGRGK